MLALIQHAAENEDEANSNFRAFSCLLLDNRTLKIHKITPLVEKRYQEEGGAAQINKSLTFIYSIHTLHRRIQKNMVQPVLLFNHQTILTERDGGGGIGSFYKIYPTSTEMSRNKSDRQSDEMTDEILSLLNCNYRASFRRGNGLVESPPLSASVLNTRQQTHSFLKGEATFFVL